jgi:hypothetical protein
LKDSSRKAMFAKGKTKYSGFSTAKLKMRTIAKDNGLKNQKDWDNFVAKKPVTFFKKLGIAKHPEIIWSKSNVFANYNAGIDIKKEVYY